MQETGLRVLKKGAETDVEGERQREANVGEASNVLHYWQ